MNDETKKQLGILEGILFVVGDEGVTIDTLTETMSLSEDRVKELL